MNSAAPVDRIIYPVEDWNQTQSQYSSTLEKYPHYKHACENVYGYKTADGNIAFRRWCIEKAEDDPLFADNLWIMCKRDFLFFVNTFLFVYEPREVKGPRILPFITYGFQDICFDEICMAIEGQYDQLTEKSRTMGASWMYLTVFFWYWMFYDDFSFRVVSRNEDLVDKTGDPDSLFWKLEHHLKYLPWFMKPKYTKNHLGLTNHDNNTTITGCTTTGDVARGGRCTAMLLDEFGAVPNGFEILPSTQHVTKCRLFNSTHKGAGTAFYYLSQKKTQRKMIVHWALHPLYNKGLYYSINRELFIVDKDYPFPDDYPFELDGKLRSPWYDNECDRATHVMMIAQELDMDAMSSDSQFFDTKIITTIDKLYVTDPFLEGMLEFDERFDPVFVPREGGPVKLWVNLTADGRIPRGLECGVGADISAGTGASNSTLSGLDLNTGDKIMEYASCDISPEDFAELSVAMCKFLNDAKLIWDAGGHGESYGQKILKTPYRNLYWKRKEGNLSKTQSDKPGFYIGNQNEKKALLGNYRQGLKKKFFHQTSQVANQECLFYVYVEGGASVEHSQSINTIDPSGAKANHGDRVIADALAYKLVSIAGRAESRSKPLVKKYVPPGLNNALARKSLRQQEAKRKKW